MDKRDNHLKGLISKASGASFERVIEETLEWYKRKGVAWIDKTPEPFKIIKPLSNGQYICTLDKKAQPDFKGVIKGGRSIVFEAKYTSTEKMEQRRVADHQGQYLEEAQKMGALCYVMCGFSSGKVYRVPWDIWRDMKLIYGRRYVNEVDLFPYQVPKTFTGTAFILGGIEDADGKL